MNNSCAVSTTSSEASDIANGEVTWTPACDWVSVNQSSLVATVDTQPETRTADRRCCTVTGKVTFRTTDHTDSTDICQKALTGDWVFSATSYYDLTITASTTSSIGCCGGDYGVNGTGYYFDRYFWKDSCNREYRESPFDDRKGTESLGGGGGGGCTSCEINGSSSIGSGGGNIQLSVTESSGGGDWYVSGHFSSCDCCSSPHCCDGCSDSDTLTINWHGLSKSADFTQSCSRVTTGCIQCDSSYTSWDASPCTAGVYGEQTQWGTYYYNCHPDSTYSYCECDNSESTSRTVDCGDAPDPCPGGSCTECDPDRITQEYDWASYQDADPVVSSTGTTYYYHCGTHHYCKSPSDQCPYCYGGPETSNVPFSIPCGTYGWVGNDHLYGGDCG